MQDVRVERLDHLGIVVGICREIGLAEYLDAHTLAVTFGYSRDHRADLKQWMLALATTRAGDVPLFCQALGGTASDKVSLVAAVETDD
jgi:transposase